MSGGPPAVAGLVLLVLLSGCAGGVEVADPDLEPADRARCDALVDDLPDTLFGQSRREVDPADAPAAAWGDPAVVLECGAPEPEEYDEFSACNPIGGAGWFMPDTQLKDTAGEIEVTAMSHSPRLRIVVPPEHRSRGADAALAALGPLVAEHLEETRPCH